MPSERLSQEASPSALIVVDVQRGFQDPRWGERNNPGCEERIARLLSEWRSRIWPIVLVRHDSIQPGSPLAPGQPGNDLEPLVEGDHDLLVAKCVNSAFYGQPNLDRWLSDWGIEGVVICGITTNHCCETTARMAGNLGYKTTFVIDATYTFGRHTPDGVYLSADELTRATAANLQGEFANVVATAELLERATRTAPGSQAGRQPPH